MPNRAEQATQRVWTIHKGRQATSVDSAPLTWQGVVSIIGPETGGPVEVLPTSLLGELAEWCEVKADHRRRSAERWRRSEMPLVRAEREGQSTAFSGVAAKLRSLLSQEEPDGEQ